MQQRTTARTASAFAGRACTVALAAILATSGVAVPRAEAVTSQELWDQADQIMQRIDALQTDLNQANEDYDAALAAHDEAQASMEDAQGRIEDAEGRIDELQGHLGERAVEMYKGGNLTFLDVFVGSASFEEFLTLWDAFDRINQQDAQMVQDTKDARAEAEQARSDFESECDRASEEMDKAEQLADQIEATQASLQEEVDKISAEAAELQAEEEAAAEAARQAAEAAAAAERQAQEQAQQQAAAGNNASSGGSGGSSTVVGSGAFAHPCPTATVSSTFGYRDFDSSFHKGVDFAAAEGTPYYAAESGTVIIAGYSASAGNWIVISHGNGLITKYMHSSSLLVSAGQQVTTGQQIGTVGNTGNSFGAHLHFQVEVNASSWSGTAVDPFLYL